MCLFMRFIILDCVHTCSFFPASITDYITIMHTVHLTVVIIQKIFTNLTILHVKIMKYDNIFCTCSTCLKKSQKFDIFPETESPVIRRYD